MKRSSVVTVLILILIVAVVGWYAFSNREAQQRIGSDAGKALLGNANTLDGVGYTNLAGEAVVLDQYVGQVVVATVWATWCPMCAAQLQQLAQAAEAYPDEGIVFLAFNRKESKEQVARYQRAVTLPDAIEFIIDTEDHFYTSMGGYAMPETVIYDETGAIVAHFRGEVSSTQIRDALSDISNSN